MATLRRILLTLALIAPIASAQETHNHPAPEKLGKVSFPISCKPAVQDQFDRGVALLHSFAYAAAEKAFQGVAEVDPQCAMAHWGIAMTYFHQLWDPPLAPQAMAAAQTEILRAQEMGTGSARERQFIAALALIYQDVATVAYPARASEYEHAMRDLSLQNKNDVETQVFYALALLANASPADKTHEKQKQAIELLEPLDRAHPEHPGIPHYLIHACDNAELAPRGLAAAKAYSQIAPSAPHALHMPSHIFTRLGLWDDSAKSNIAARNAAHEQGDTGEELHAMDYLVYAYLQSGHDAEAAQVIAQLKSMTLNRGDFKAGYASTAMPVRYAVERKEWTEASEIVPPEGAPPHAVAVAVWARGMGFARSGHTADARSEIDRLRQIEEQLRAAGNSYWATQVKILTREVMAWSAQADKQPGEAVALLRAAADEEDAVEKLPVTPGPVVPAREQLGELLLEQNRPELALKEFKTGLANAPGRKGALQGAAQATELAHRKSAAYPTKLLRAGETFRDCAGCSEMVVVPAGSFLMGSPASEPGRYQEEGPPHRVDIRQFAVGKFDVTRGQWAGFVAATNRDTRDGCDYSELPKNSEGKVSWKNLGFPQDETHPVVCVTWKDAQEYVQWLSQRTGFKYRLLTEAEWEYAARAGTTTAYPWGATASHEAANYGADDCCSGLASGHDRWKNTSPVGSFPPNAFGLYDMHGDVLQWVQDCFAESYSGLPADGTAYETAATLKVTGDLSNMTGSDSCSTGCFAGAIGGTRRARFAPPSGISPLRRGERLRRIAAREWGFEWPGRFNSCFFS